jgi:hypothetical protein
MKERNIISIVRNLLNETYQTLQETQLRKDLRADVDKTVSKLSLVNLSEEPFPYNEKYILKEVENIINFKLNNISMKGEFDYENFYIVKLGEFIIKDGNDKKSLTFSVEGVDRNVSFAYVYIYQDMVWAFRMGSQFYQNDDILKKEAEDFAKKRNLEKSPIIMDHNYESDNIINLTKYSNQKVDVKKEPSLAKEKNEYRTNSPIIHPKFGKGVILGKKKYGVNDERFVTYKVTVKFDDKTRDLVVASKKEMA